MSNYRKTMASALQEMYSLDESVIDKVKEIDSKKSAAKIDGVMVDSFTASAISQIYDKVNDANKKKMEKLPIIKLANLAMKMMQKNDYVPEEVDLDEAQDGGDFKPHMMYDPKTGKGYKADTMDDHLRMKKMGYTHDAPKKEEVDLDEASARSDAMKAMRKGKSVDPADIDNTATDDDVKGASKNIIMQLRKSISLRGNFSVEFGDGKKVKIPAAVAQAITQKHNLLKKPADKEKFQAQITKSYKDMLKILKAGYGEQKESILERMNRKIKENKNG